MTKNGCIANEAGAAVVLVQVVLLQPQILAHVTGVQG